MAGKDNLLLFGALGYIGAYITDSIVASKDKFGRIVIFTSTSTAESKKAKIDELKGQGVEVIVGDVNNESDVLKAFDGITTIVSAVGRTGILTQIRLIELASRPDTSIKRFFPSEFGTDIEYGPKSAGEPTHQAKLKVRAALKAQQKLEYTYVVTGPYVEGFIGKTANAPIAGSYLVKEKKAKVIGDGNGKVSLITQPDVGKLTTLALLAPSETVKNRALKVNSFTSTPLEIAAEYERQLNTGKWDITYTPLEEIKALEKKAYDEKAGNATIFTLRRIWAEGGTLYEKRDNGILGKEGEETETLEIAVKRAIEVQLNE